MSRGLSDLKIKKMAMQSVDLLSAQARELASNRLPKIVLADSRGCAFQPLSDRTENFICSTCGSISVLKIMYASTSPMP